MLYAYAILLKHEGTIPSLVGISGQALATVATDHLVAIVEEGLRVDQLKQLPEPDLVRAIVIHDQIICRLFGSHTLLPLRFGTAFISSSALISYLQSGQESLLRKLSLLVGKAEYVLELSPKPLSLSSTGSVSGKSYLMAKKSQYQELTNYQLLVEEERSQWQNSIQTWCHHQQIPWLLKEDNPLKFYLLLSDEQLNELQIYLANALGLMEHPRWTWDISPPTPPYHFTHDQTG
jgi:hypothetical protein